MENIQPIAWRTSNGGIVVPSSLSRQLWNDLKHRAAAEIVDFTLRYSAKLGSAIQPSNLAEWRLPPRHVSISSSAKRVQDGFRPSTTRAMRWAQPERNPAAQPTTSGTSTPLLSCPVQLASAARSQARLR